MKKQLYGSIKMDRKLLDKDIWKAISEQLTPHIKGQVVLRTGPNKAIENVTLTIEEAINLKSSPISFEVIPQISSFANLLLSVMGQIVLEDSWILTGKVKLNGVVTPIFIIQNEELSFSWFTTMTTEQYQNLLKFTEECRLEKAKLNWTTEKSTYESSVYPGFLLLYDMHSNIFLTFKYKIIIHTP